MRPQLVLFLGIVTLPILGGGCTNEAQNDKPTASAADDSASTKKSESSAAKQETKKRASKPRPLVVEQPNVIPPQNMVWIPGGEFLMGSDNGIYDEKPVHSVELDGFWMDTTEVTNAEYKRFVDATGYVTLAERKPKREDIEDQLTPEQLARLDESMLEAGSVCFNPAFDRSIFPKNRRPSPNEINLVWKYEKGANWKNPTGTGSNLAGKMNHPVVHLAWDDCVAYCDWAGKRLPTEAEWEYAARGGKEQQIYPWGDSREVDGKWMANIWQGKWPFENYKYDGFAETSPVKSFEPNGYGLYDMSGNVWEWCYDYYREDYYASARRRNPRGPSSSFDRNEPNVAKRVQRGGSFMCNANYCTGYRVAARMKGDLLTGTWHCGFRCVVDSRMYEKFTKAKGALLADKKPAENVQQSKAKN